MGQLVTSYMTIVIAQLLTAINEFVTRRVTLLMTSVRNPVYIPVCDQFSDPIDAFSVSNPITDPICIPISDLFCVTNSNLWWLHIGSLIWSLIGH